LNVLRCRLSSPSRGDRGRALLRVGKTVCLIAWLIAAVAVEARAEPPVTFAVLGHLRGDAGRPNYLMGELLEEVRVVKPDFVVLTGDMIYGDTHADTPIAKSVEAEWDALDAWLAELAVPSYRVPGSHDVHDPTTRDIYVNRYGDLVRAVTVGRVRLLLLNSTDVPQEGDTGQWGGHRDIGAGQIEFIKRHLADAESYDHAFVFLHHLLWWKSGAAWWKTVHPLLVDRKVRAVFSGEYGPMKFSHVNRDGVDYFQGSIESAPAEDAVVHARHRLPSRMLSLQFDNFLYVTVDGADWKVHVETLGETSSRKFTPQFWHESNQSTASSQWIRLWEIVGRPKRLGAAAVMLLMIFALGYLMSAWRGRRAAARCK